MGERMAYAWPTLLGTGIFHNDPPLCHALHSLPTLTLPAPARPDPARPDLAHPDTAHPDPARHDPARPDPARPAAPCTARSDPARPHPARPHPACPAAPCTARSAVRTAGGAVTDSPGGAAIRTTTTVHETITVTASRPVSGAGGARGAGPSAAAAAATAQQYSDADDSVDAYLMRTSVQFKGPFTPRVSPTDKTLEDRPRETRHIEYSDDDS